MNETLANTMNMIRAISANSRIKHGRTFGDFLADRIVQSATEPTLLAANERLQKLMNTDIGWIQESTISAFMHTASRHDAQTVLAWLREYPRVASMLCMLEEKDYEEAIGTISIQGISNRGAAIPDASHEISIRITCLNPLAHGADSKAGNATLFRRMRVLSTEGSILTLPYYAGNALRGQMRDALADDFLRAMGIVPRRDNPPLALWFFHTLYAGGSLEENSAAERALKKHIGESNSLRVRGIREFRDTLPGLSLLGCALGNRVLSGRIRVGDFRPACRQWGNGDIDVGELFEWLYLTRRDDHEDTVDHRGMIASTECLRAGTSLLGGIDVDGYAMPLERSALGRGLQLVAERGYIGAENRRGVGRVSIECENAPDPSEYREYLENNKRTILSYLEALGAVSHACD